MHTCAYSSLPPPCEEGFRGGSCLCSQVEKIVVGEVEEMCEQKKKNLVIRCGRSDKYASTALTRVRRFSKLLEKWFPLQGERSRSSYFSKTKWRGG